MALLYIVILIPVGVVLLYLYVFFREVVNQHFQRIIINREGNVGRLVFFVDATFMIGFFLMAVIWIVHTVNK